MASLWGRIIGEISKLRLSSLFGFTAGSAGASYKLDSSRVNYELARQLYSNTAEEYKLGAGFAKPIINTLTAFMDIPRLTMDNGDDDAQRALDLFFLRNKSRMQTTHQNALRDGDCYVWLTRQPNEDDPLYPEDSARIRYNIIPPEQVKEIIRNPFTQDVVEYVLASTHEWKDESGQKKKCTITQRISAKRKKVEVNGDIPIGMTVGEEENIWGFIPIVHFKNESDESREYGQSELEPIEPFLKAYHDVMLHAIQGSKMHSTPKLKLKLSEVEAFLMNNFGIDDPEKFAAEGGTIDLQGHELLILGDQEDASYIEVKSATGDAISLLKLLFYAIVDTSEVPEFVFGVHTPSSLSSVKEQMPILIRRINRKREHFTESWQTMARMVLAMTAMADGMRFASHATTVEWEPIDPRSGKEMAEELNLVTQALERAVDKDLISHEAAVAFLAQYIDTMLDYETEGDAPDERTRIMKSRLMKMRLEDGQFLEEQKNEIDRELSGAV